MNSIQLRTLDGVPLGEYADCAGGRIFKSGSRPVSSPSSNTLGTNSHSRVTRALAEFKMFPGARQLVRRSFTQATFRTGSGSSRRGSSRS